MTPTETQPDFSRYQAAIFDLDGTLVHSEHAWEAAKIDVLDRYGIVPSRTLLDEFIGQGLGGFLDAAFERPVSVEERRGLADEIGAAADLLLPRMRKPIAGACELLFDLQDAGLRIAVCSSSPRRHIVSALDMLGIENRIETVISAAELARGKPDPLPYLATLAALDLQPQVACAFEDSLPGATSANAAGMPVFAIGTGCTGPRFSFCHFQAESFHEFVQT